MKYSAFYESLCKSKRIWFVKLSIQWFISKPIYFVRECIEKLAEWRLASLLCLWIVSL